MKSGARVKFASLRARQAFTLVELLVVIAIIGLLSSVAVVSLSGARTKARDAKRVADIAQLQKALELYYSVNSQYPGSGGATAPNAGWSTSNDSSWASLQTQLGPYIATLPKDPIQSAAGWAGTAGVYAYSYDSIGGGCPYQWYMIVYQLETADGRPDPGARDCNNALYQYGSGSSTAIKTVGYKAK